jgi:hypothetical protein
MDHRALVPAAAAAVLIVALAGCGGTESTALSEKTLSYSERQNDDSFSFADNPPTSAATEGEPQLSNGDQITFTSDMIDGSGKDVGDLDATCTVTSTESGSFDDSNAQCVGTVEIPGGSLTLSVGGSAFGAGTTRGAVIGGTDDFAGATGTFTSSDEAGTDKPSQDTFDLFIPEQ